MEGVNMSTDKTSKNIPRRKFIKDTLTGIAGAGVILGAGPALAKPDKTTKSVSKQTVMKNAQKISLTVNGKSYSKKISPQTTLAELLRNDLNLTGTKIFCGQGECGSCTVLINNKPVYSCHMLALDADEQKVLTIEGITSDDNTAASTTVFYSDDITEATADHYKGRIVIFTSDILENQATDITAYALDTGEGKFTVTALTEAPPDNSTFIIV